tara:strand:+ start:185 stop:298 length:114 start_codon:yes stop_codon:yes gene_type:complete
MVMKNKKIIILILALISAIAAGLGFPELAEVLKGCGG